MKLHLALSRKHPVAAKPVTPRQNNISMSDAILGVCFFGHGHEEHIANQWNSYSGTGIVAVSDLGDLQKSSAFPENSRLSPERSSFCEKTQPSQRWVLRLDAKHESEEVAINFRWQVHGLTKCVADNMEPSLQAREEELDQIILFNSVFLLCMLCMYVHTAVFIRLILNFHPC